MTERHRPTRLLTSFTTPMPVLHYLAELRAGIMVFLWCGLHLTDEERQGDPFQSPVLLPCVNFECDLFREDSPFCTHMITVGPLKKV